MHPAMDLDTFAKRLERALLRRGWSAATLAEELKISESFLSQIKLGDRPGTEQMVPMARKLEVRIEWLTTGEEPMRIIEESQQIPTMSERDRATLQAAVDLIRSHLDGISRALDRVLAPSTGAPPTIHDSHAQVSDASQQAGPAPDQQSGEHPRRSPRHPRPRGNGSG